MLYSISKSRPNHLLQQSNEASYLGDTDLMLYKISKNWPNHLPQQSNKVSHLENTDLMLYHISKNGPNQLLQQSNEASYFGRLTLRGTSLKPGQITFFSNQTRLDISGRLTLCCTTSLNKTAQVLSYETTHSPHRCSGGRW